MSRAKNPKYESMSLEELKANMEKSRQELEAAIHHKNILEQRKKPVSYTHLDVYKRQYLQ